MTKVRSEFGGKLVYVVSPTDASRKSSYERHPESPSLRRDAAAARAVT
jgi:hypothetical protein